MAKPKYPNLDSVTGIKELLKIVSGLDTKGREVIMQALSTELSDAKKQQVIAILRQHVQASDVAIRNWLVQGMSASYVAGSNFASQSLKAVKFNVPEAIGGGLVTMTPELLTTAIYMKPHLQVVNTLLSSAYLDFGNAMTGYMRGAENILNDALKRQLRSNIAEGRLEGAAIKTIRNTVKETLGNKGFTVLIDRGGKQWDLGRYSEMLARTHINKAANEAVVNRNSDWGVDIFQVSEHGADDDACSREEGKIYSASGRSENYPKLDGHEPPYHPNCTHNLIPRPDLQ